MYYAIQTNLPMWDLLFDLTKYLEAFTELQFWKDNVSVMNSRRLFTKSLPSILSFSDASNKACGSVVSPKTSGGCPQQMHISHKKF